MAKERRDTKNRLLWKGEYQKADGRYMYRYTDVNGAPRFIYSWTLTQTDRAPKGRHSEKCLRELEKEIARDVQDEIDVYLAKKTTLNAYFENYIEQRKELKNATLYQYSYMYRKYVYDEIGQKKIADIKYSDIKKFYQHMIGDVGFKLKSLKLIDAILHSAFSVAVRDEIIRKNPTDGVVSELTKICEFKEEKRHALTESQQAAFINYVKNDKKNSRWLSLFIVLLGTGGRIGEILGLRWADCDFEKNLISINHNLIYKPDYKTRKNTFQITTPKTKAGTREIPMLGAVREALLDERSRQEVMGFNKMEVDGYSGFVFQTKNNTLLTADGVDEVIRKIIRNYNCKELIDAELSGRDPILLPHFSAHNLRHTFCTRFCENETNLKVIQEIMGHANISITMDVYNEATNDMKQEAFRELENKIKFF